MARPTTQRSSAQGYGPADGAFRTGIRAPQAAGVDQTAASLQQALGIIGDGAMKAYDNIEVQRGKQGALDASTGTVDEKKLAHSRAYEKAVVQTQAAAKFVEAESSFREWYDQNFDKNKGTPQELSQKLDEFFTENYGHVNDKLEAEVLVPRMAEMRTRLLKEQQANVQDAVKTEQVQGVSTLIRDAVSNGKPVDVDAMKSQLLPMFSKAEAAAHYADIVGTLAVERGDPSLIDHLIPEKWADGTPGPRSISKIGNQLNQYRAYAESAAHKAEAETRNAAKVRNEQGQVDIVMLAIGGDIAAAHKRLAELANTGTLDRSDVTAIDNFITGKSNEQKTTTFDAAAYIQWRSNLVENPEVYSDPMYIIRNQEALFAPGSARDATIQRAMDDAISARRAFQTTKLNPRASAYRSAIANQFKPDAVASQPERELYAASLLEFDKTFNESSDPEKANEAARVVMEKGKDLRKETTLKDDIKSLTEGRATAESLRSKYLNTDAASAIRGLIKRGDITEEQALAAINALK